MDEDYDLVFDDDDFDWAGVEPFVDADSLVVSATAQRAFTKHHQVLPEVAIAEITALAAQGQTNGTTTRNPDGRMVLRVEKFTLFVSPNGKTALGYRTKHFERTPTQVFSGIPSRFGAGKGGSGIRREPGPPKPMTELRLDVNPSTVFITSLAISQFAKSERIDRRDPEASARMRAAFGQAFEHGVWAASSCACHPSPISR